MSRSNPALWLAAALSAVLSVAAGVSGWQRGGNALESTLWAVLSILAVLVVHVLPALLYRRGWLALAALPVWLGVFAVVAFSHAQFFTFSEQHAGRERVLRSEDTLLDEANPRHPTGAGPAPGRTAASVARDLAKATAALVWLPEAKRPAQQQAIAALQTELAVIREQEARETDSVARQRASIEARQADPVGLRLGQVLGLTTDAVMLAVSLVTALMLELASVILWRLVLVATVPCETKAGSPANEHRLLSLLAAFWKRRRTGQEADQNPGQTLEASMEPVQPDSVPVTSSSDAQAILTLLKVKGAVSLGTLQASVSKRLRPVLADLLAALESAGQIKVTAQGRGKLVALV